MQYLPIHVFAPLFIHFKTFNQLCIYAYIQSIILILLIKSRNLSTIRRLYIFLSLIVQVIYQSMDVIITSFLRPAH